LACSILMCANPLDRDQVGAALIQCADNLRFALIGAALLLINVFVPRETIGETAS
jgi:hypothetical protein